MNKFRSNARVAKSYVQSQQIKGWFMANAQTLAVILSGIMMFMGVTLMYSGIHLTFTLDTLFKLLAVSPIALVAGPISILVEGMTIIAANGVREVGRKIEGEISVINKIKVGLTIEEKQSKIKAIKRQRYWPIILLLVFASFSMAGAELFWHSITEQAGLFFEVIGYIIGAVVSVSLTYIELHQDLIERGIDRSISSTAMVYKAMEYDSRSQILDQLDRSRSNHLKSSEFQNTLREAAYHSLFGVLSETVNNLGVSISAEQLNRMVTSKQEEKMVAENIIAGGQIEEPLQIGPGTRKEYHSKKATLVRDLVKKYSRDEILRDPEKYASEIGVSVNTLKKYA